MVPDEATGVTGVPSAHSERSPLFRFPSSIGDCLALVHCQLGPPRVVRCGGPAALSQAEDAFDDVGEMFMPGLWFWNPHDEYPARKMKAKSLASQMEKVFRLVFEGKVKAGLTPVDAMTAMAEIL